MFRQKLDMDGSYLRSPTVPYPRIPKKQIKRRRGRTDLSYTRGSYTRDLSPDLSYVVRPRKMEERYRKSYTKAFTTHMPEAVP